MEKVDENAQTLRFERIIAAHVPVKGGYSATHHYVIRPRFPWRGFTWGFACGGFSVLLILLGAMR